MKIKSGLSLAFSILLTVAGLSACNRSDKVEAAREPDSVNDRGSVLNQGDKDFIVYASEMHVGEINMAKQAKEKSMNKDVRDYADSVIRAHSDALDQLSDAMDKNAPDSKVGSLDTKMHMQFLASLPEEQFNREFITLMIADHRDASETFRSELGSTQNEDLKNYVQKALPALENGLQDAQKLEKGMTPQKAKS